MEKPKKQIQFSLRLKTIKALKDYCKKNGYNLSELAGIAIDSYIKLKNMPIVDQDKVAKFHLEMVEEANRQMPKGGIL